MSDDKPDDQEAPQLAPVESEAPLMTQLEHELLGKVKAKGAEIGELIAELRAMDGLDQRWISTGATDIQKGLMCVTRRIAQPDSF